MKSPWQVLVELENTPSRLAKEKIIAEQARAGNDELFDGLRMALDSMVTFGLKQIPSRLDVDGPGLSWEAFSLVITGFVSRSITGNTARDMVNSLMNSATNHQWNHWYRRILIKDLRAGLSEKTVNKVVEKINPEYVIPTFNVQLASDIDGHRKKLTGKKMLQYKLDGTRCITVVYPGGKVDQFSRNGKELLNFDTIREQFRKPSISLNEPMVFDGEIVSTSFQELMKQVHRKTKVDTSDAKLCLFDAISLEDFESGRSDVTQMERAEWLNQWKDLWKEETLNIQVLDYKITDFDQGFDEFDEYNQSALDQGFEGLVIKNVDAPYECKRSANWLKVKPVLSLDLTVTAIEEGTGRNVGKLGALVCHGTDQDREITVNVGSGFSDQQREEFWQNQESLIGQIVEVMSDVVTKNQDGTYSLRFPRFKCFRSIEPQEKI